MSRPSSSTRPATGFWNPLSTLRKVVLPAPLGPMRPTISPGLTSKSTSSRARTPLKETPIPSVRSAGPLMSAPRPRQHGASGTYDGLISAARAAFPPVMPMATKSPSKGMWHVGV